MKNINEKVALSVILGMVSLIGISLSSLLVRPNIEAAATVAKTFAIGNEDTLSYSLGLIIDEAAYDTVKQLPSYQDTKFNDLPNKVDLRPYAPTAASQGKIGSCVGWSLGYNALTIQQAIERGWYGKEEVTHNAMSALFLYNQIKLGDCFSGALMPTALEFLKIHGDCSARYFDYDVNDCHKQPTYELQQSAREYTIKDYMALFGSREEPDIKIFKLKQSLSENKPPVVAMLLRRNIVHVNEQTDFVWEPEEGDTRFWGGHALTVVGYDDGKRAFEIMNSWGTRWGNEGFVWVKYKDMGRFCKYAYQIHINPVVQDFYAYNNSENRAGEIGTLEQNSRFNNNQSYPTPVVRQHNAKPISSNSPHRQLQPNNNPPINTPESVVTYEPEPINPAKPAIPSNNNQQVTTFQQQPTNRADPPVPDNNNQQVTTFHPKPVNQPITRVPTHSNVQSKKRNSYNSQSKYASRLVTSPAKKDTWYPTQNEVTCMDMCLGGSFKFQYLADEEELVFDKAVPVFKKDRYTLRRSDWKIGQLFQLVATNDIKDEYMYVFSVDSENKVEVHWPRQERLSSKFENLNETSLVPFKGATVIIPDSQGALQIAHSGKDYLCVLFSCREIYDFKRLLNTITITTPEEELMDRLKKVLGKRLIPQQSILYYPNEIGFKTCPKNPTHGTVVALVLEVEAN